MSRVEIPVEASREGVSAKALRPWTYFGSRANRIADAVSVGYEQKRFCPEQLEGKRGQDLSVGQMRHLGGRVGRADL